MKALTGVYYTLYAWERITEAQHVIDQHVVCAYTGICHACGRPGPCPNLDAAQTTLARYTALPHRRPGASLTRPPAPRTGFTWLTRHHQPGEETR